MAELLGLDTRGNFKDGRMQDVHWPERLFGYFPCYSLGRDVRRAMVRRDAARHARPRRAHRARRLDAGVRLAARHIW